ncbi:MauE/DoxX family redox-associated membrane protein [Janthinobacterium sp. NKUCC06_STL]|uniref:MauE/DoxX family redox-associated membrane protein n=1 Tax=Janthinobacterium sp. NKUCC06_STL TaxID=2842127 RepID=UPI00214C9476|nr:MauE/DoxX family redox-associated membrane protein [Janthinobacterium sp. NKUCC06_STL]
MQKFSKNFVKKRRTPLTSRVRPKNDHRKNLHQLKCGHRSGKVLILGDHHLSLYYGETGFRGHSTRLLLGGVLQMAAAGKLLHRQAYAQTLAEFGIPAVLQPQLAWLMPTCELAIAFMLTLAMSTWWGAIAGAALLALYSAVLVYKLQQGQRPSCNCFGQQDATPIGPATLLRNGVLLSMAGALIYAGPAGRIWPRC